MLNLWKAIKKEKIRGAFIRRNHWGSLVVILVLLLCLLPIQPTFAQENPAEIQITSINTANYPEIALDYKGVNLTEALPTNPANIEIIENGQTIKPTSIEEHYKGVHFAVAINADSSLTLRGPDGQPYNLAMIDQLKRVGPEPDNARNNRYSYFSNPEVSLVETDDYVAWAKLFDDFEKIPTDKAASLGSLELAVSALEHSSLSMDTVMVYITPYLDFRLLHEFYDLIERAGKLGAEIQVWIVMSQRIIGSSYETEMQTALQNVGGTLIPLTTIQSVPDPRETMEGKGRTFTAKYESQIRKSGDYELAVRANFDNISTLQSEPAALSLEVEPTKLSFINPIDTLEIRYNNDGSFQPVQMPLEVLIEFPDGYPRSIISSTLFVNGKSVSNNTQPPYGSFILDLANYVDETDLELQVRIQDEFGLEGRTPVQTIALDVFKPENSSNGSWYSRPWIWLGLLALAGAVAFLVFQKPLPKLKSVEENDNGNGKVEIAPDKTPLYPPVPEKVFGSLTRLDPDQTPSAEKPHLLTKEIILIGRDPSLANLVLGYPSIEPLHAEIHFFPDGRIRLTDFNSTSGTYINFKPVGTHGTTLQHADLVHFGTLLFRFSSATRTQSNNTPKE